MMGMMALLLILWFGPLVLSLRGGGWFMQFVILPCCLGPPAIWTGGWVHGPVAVLLMLRMLLNGLTLLVFWLSGLLF